MSRRGFTMVELMVGLLVAGGVALITERVFRATLSGSSAIQAGRISLDREMNGRRLLAAAFSSIEAGGDSALRFEGRPESVRFGCWLQTPEQWFERRTVELGLDSGRLRLLRSDGMSVILADSVESLALDYLLSPGAQSAWAREWISPVGAPFGIRVRVARRAGSEIVADTTIYLIGARG